MLNRRKTLQGMAAGAALGLPLASDRLWAAPTRATTGKRIIFFMQNQGFDPQTCIPSGMSSSGSLAGVLAVQAVDDVQAFFVGFQGLNGLRQCGTSQ